MRLALRVPPPPLLLALKLPIAAWRDRWLATLAPAREPAPIPVRPVPLSQRVQTALQAAARARR